MPRILLIDNYDSFTYNLEHYLVSAGGNVEVVLNDQLDLNDLYRFDGLVLSPGPGLPENAGLMMRVLEEVNGKIPILGVCLGMQGIAIHLGATIYNQKTVRHGVKTKILHDGSGILNSVDIKFDAALYHSWAVNEEGGDFRVTARSSDGIIMAIENMELGLYGVQFHPESVMTESGIVIIENFLEIVRKSCLESSK